MRLALRFPLVAKDVGGVPLTGAMRVSPDYLSGDGF